MLIPVPNFSITITAAGGLSGGGVVTNGGTVTISGTGLLVDPTTAEGDMIYRTGGSAKRLPVGQAQSLLGTHDGVDPAYLTIFDCGRTS